MGFDVHLYDLLHVGNPGDLEYYLEVCGAAERILELGCGSGRVGLALARKGCHVTGVDNDTGMVQAFNLGAARLECDGSAEAVTGDMRDVDLGRRFDKVIIPFNSLLCMLTEADVVRSLRRAAAHLTPEGTLIFDFYYVPPDLKNEGESDSCFEQMGLVEDDGVPVRVYEKTFVRKDPQRFDTAYQMVVEGGPGKGNIWEFEIPQRCIYVEDLERLLAAAGLRLVSVQADFSDEDLTEDTGQVAVRATISAG